MRNYLPLLIIAFLFASINTNAQLQGQARIDSLEAELPNAKKDTNHVNLLNDITFAYYRINPDKGIEYGEGAVKLAEKLNWRKGFANAYNSLGANYRSKSDYPKALEYFQKALNIYEELSNKNGIAKILGNMGVICVSQSNYPKALEYYQKALKIKEEIGDKNGAAINLGNMGNLYRIQSDYPKALEYYQKALKIFEELDNKNGIAVNLGNMGSVYLRQSDYPKALEYYQKALNIYEELGNKNGIARNLGNMGIVYRVQSDYPKALEYYGKALKINEELGDKRGVAYNFGNMGVLYLNISQDSVQITPNELNQYVSLNKEINLNKSIEYSMESIRIFEEIGELDYKSTVLKTLADAYKLKGNHEKRADALEEYQKLKDSVFNQEKQKKINELEKAREEDLKQKEIEKQKAINAEQKKREELILYFSIGFFIVMAIVLLVIYRQRKTSDKLLLNILPATIAKRLKKKENPIADHFDNASIVFIDIVGFTTLASDAKAERVVEVLDKIFKQFDEIADKYNLEKIKTIGDSYMAVAGVPIPDPNHANNMANFALEVMQNMTDYRTEDSTLIQFRIGIASGDVVAGVIGTSKFIYDLWGDTVNIASRMESTGTPGKIQVTEDFKESLAEEFSFEERGEIKVKGKGKMQTYYLEGKKNKRAH